MMSGVSTTTLYPVKETDKMFHSIEIYANAGEIHFVQTKDAVYFSITRHF